MVAPTATLRTLRFLVTVTATAASLIFVGCTTKPTSHSAKADYALKKTERLINRYEGKIPQNREPTSSAVSNATTNASTGP
jgi:hypothetical protein